MHSFSGDWLLVRKESPIVPGHFPVIFPPTMPMRTDVERHSGRVVVNWVPSKHSYTVAFKVQRAGGRSTCVKILSLYLFFSEKVNFIIDSKLLNATCSMVIICSTHIRFATTSLPQIRLYSQHSKLYFT